MATLEQLIQFQITLTGENTPRKFGNKANPVNITVTGQVFDSGGVIIVDDYTAKPLWATGQGGLTTFSQLLYTSNVDTYLQLANVALATDEHAILQCKANQVISLGGGKIGGYVSNTDRLDGNVLVSGTDYHECDQIIAYRDAADLAGDATVRLMLIL